jgi:hypothetical protein
MARTRVYVGFDADTDMDYYRLLQAWSENDKFDFDLNNAHDLTDIRQTSNEDTIKRHLRERMNNSKVLLLLVGAKTHTLRKYVPYEIDLALQARLPIIVVNLNKNRSHDTSLCPSKLDDQLAIHVGYYSKIINYALNHWPESHRNHQINGLVEPRSYKDHVYKDLGIT